MVLPLRQVAVNQHLQITADGAERHVKGVQAVQSGISEAVRVVISPLPKLLKLLNDPLSFVSPVFRRKSRGPVGLDAAMLLRDDR